RRSILVRRDDLAAVVGDQPAEDAGVGRLLDEVDRAVGEGVVRAAGVEGVDLVVVAAVGVAGGHAVAIGVELGLGGGPARAALARALLEDAPAERQRPAGVLGHDDRAGGAVGDLGDPPQLVAPHDADQRVGRAVGVGEAPDLPRAVHAV